MTSGFRISVKERQTNGSRGDSDSRGVRAQLFSKPRPLFLGETVTNGFLENEQPTNEYRSG
jgi:hypothetical protein